jgi:hypothetical protein
MPASFCFVSSLSSSQGVSAERSLTQREASEIFPSIAKDAGYCFISEFAVAERTFTGAISALSERQLASNAIINRDWVFIGFLD